jgi:hypothetical protein
MSFHSDLSISIEDKITALEPLLNRLLTTTTLQQKLDILNSVPLVANHAKNLLSNNWSLEEEVVIKSVVAIGQAPYLFYGIEHIDNPASAAKPLIEMLIEVNQFYDTMGGIVGYYVTFLQLMVQKSRSERENIHYFHPQGLNIKNREQQVRTAIRWGIESMPLMAEIYPVGGAGDRLMLLDENTGEPLPAAELLFGGHTLLEGLIRDLQGREFLFSKLMGYSLMTPIAMMTSEEKNNDRHIHSICADNEWFGRPKESFLFFTQPLVPMINKEGNFVVNGPLKPLLKPGGHGTIWKLAYEKKIFQALKQRGRRKALIRQINNPVAGVDHTLLVLTGIGCREDKVFGFASCPRLLNAPEGMNVVLERKAGHGEYEYSLTNLEYTDFEQKGIQDRPLEEGSPYSAFPSNTNILFADLQVVEEAAKKYPIPGILINMKTKVPSLSFDGHIREIEAGRLESTMQNIADYLVEKTPYRLGSDEYTQLKTFIIFNERRKTIAVTKSTYQKGKALLGTPEGCLYDMLYNHEELLKTYCHMNVPGIGTQQDFIENGPAFIFWYHPALGPLYSIIGQKIKGGVLGKGSEMQLEIAELEMENVTVEGSLLIHAENILEGVCVLKNVTISNQGVDFSASNVFWKNQLNRNEELEIRLHGCAEFWAEGVNFKGKHHIEVPDGHRMIASMDVNGNLSYSLEKLEHSTLKWHYHFDEKDQIIIERTEK